jgi:glycosidase
MKKKFLFFCLVSFFSCYLFSQDVYPTHWWVGMKMNRIQLILHSNQPGINLYVDKLTVRSSSPDLKIIKVNKVENRRYLILDVEINPKAKPQTVEISFGGIIAREWKKIKYPLKPRSKENGKTRVKGVTSEDLVYLIMPDRFSNGDPSNDFFNSMRDNGHDRNNPFDRHGGDLKGVENHLNYLKDLGVTTVWMTPVNENDMSRTLEGGASRSTYHGYAFTDQYTIDRRLGGDEAYKKLIHTAHEKGMKIIQDAVYNHIGNDHWLYKDLPAKDWVNQWPVYTNTSYKDQPIIDPYASATDRRIALNGWFTPFLVDLNQKNPFVSNFLIQYAIWATEEYGIDGWRVDTYFYSDPAFLNKINEALLKEFPSVTVFGEAWVQSVTNSAYFCENNLNVPFKHNCQGVTDFPFLFAGIDLLNQPFGWNEGANKFYQTLAQDILYKNPFRNCIFFSNHDLDRFYSVVGEDIRKFKMGMALLLTQRGIPQLYYGDEILMKNFKNPTDAEVRKDFPGGWPGDPVNKFDASGRTAQENEAFKYIRTFANFRKNSSALKTGKLMQYLPQDGVYVYFRYDDQQTVMCVMNTNDKPATIDLSRFTERMNGYTKAYDIATGVTFNLEATLTLGEKYLLVMELKK